MHNLDSLWDCDTVFRSIELSIMVRTPDPSDPVRHINLLVSRKYSVLPRIISLDYKSVSLAPFLSTWGLPNHYWGHQTSRGQTTFELFRLTDEKHKAGRHLGGNG